MSATISPVIGEATVQELREAVKGEVIAPGDEGYAEACRIWNGMYDNRRPALIVRCEGIADVIAAVGFARSNDLPLAVRGGGHSVAGFSTVRRRTGHRPLADADVRVDPAAGVALRRRRRRLGRRRPRDAGARTRDDGRARLETGVAGFTLGGGIGWLMRKHGLACDNLVGADVVTADGQVVRASATEQPRAPLGAARRRRQLRHRHPVRAGAAPGRADRPRGAGLLPGRRRRALLRLFRDWAPTRPTT